MFHKFINKIYDFFIFSGGLGKVYDGSYSGKLTEGNWVTADLFIKNGITVYTEENFKDKITLDNKSKYYKYLLFNAV